MQKNVLLSYLLRQAQLVNYQQLDAVVQGFGLTPSQYIVLSVVHEHRDGVFLPALARRLGITPQSSHEVVADLERRGLLRRIEDPAHRRMLRVSLAPKGSTLLARCNKEVDGFEGQFFGSLSPEETTVFRETLTKLIRDARENSAGGSIEAFGTRAKPIAAAR